MMAARWTAKNGMLESGNLALVEGGCASSIFCRLQNAASGLSQNSVIKPSLQLGFCANAQGSGAHGAGQRVGGCNGIAGFPEQMPSQLPNQEYRARHDHQATALGQ